jgi:hypothetical protein
MKIKQMYSGDFKLGSSPFGNTKLKDYPTTPQALSFLESRLSFLMDDNLPTKPPQAILKGIAYKMEHIRSTLKDSFDKRFFE